MPASYHQRESSLANCTTVVKDSWSNCCGVLKGAQYQTAAPGLSENECKAGAWPPMGLWPFKGCMDGLASAMPIVCQDSRSPQPMSCQAGCLEA